MFEYHKIEGLFERDDSTKKLIWGKFRRPEIEYLKDNIWEFSEKIDGCFTSDSKLMQTNGQEISIGEVVSNKLEVEIYGYEDGKIVPTKVIGWHNNGLSDKWLNIKVSRRIPGNKGNYFKSIKCKFYKNRRRNKYG